MHLDLNFWCLKVIQKKIPPFVKIKGGVILGGITGYHGK
jgi:hypothetical protein